MRRARASEAWDLLALAGFCILVAGCFLALAGVRDGWLVP